MFRIPTQNHGFSAVCSESFCTMFRPLSTLLPLVMFLTPSPGQGEAKIPVGRELPKELMTAIIPQPKSDQRTGRSWEAGSVLIVGDRLGEIGLGIADLFTALGPWDQLTVHNPEHALPDEYPTTVVAVGAEAWNLLRKKFPTLPAPPESFASTQHYELRTIASKSGPSWVLIAGGSASAEYFAIQSLRQMILREGRISKIPETTIQDGPDFPVRGNKRFAAWMAGFKANLANQHKFFVHTQNVIPLVYSLREFHPISYPPRPPFDVMRVADSVREMERITPEPGTPGAPTPVVGFLMDDVEVTDAVSDEDRKTYGGYFQSIYAALKQSAEAVHKKNPEAQVVFMPQFYFSHNRDFVEGGRIFRESGPFPKGVGIYFNGAEVSSLFFPRQMVRDYLANLGAPEDTPVIIYDTVFDTDGDFFAVPKMDPNIAEFIQGFVPEMGNPINIGTYYDMLWNTRAYDRDRSLALACRELIGFEHWEILYRAGTAFQNMVEVPPPGTPRTETLERVKNNAREFTDAVAKLSELSEFDLTGRVDLSLLFERGSPRFFGPFQMGDFVILNRAFDEGELAKLMEKGPEIFDRESVIASAVFDNEAFPVLPADGDWGARYVGSVNTGVAPNGRPVAAFPGFPGTGVLMRLDTPLPKTDKWSVAFWIRVDDPERTAVAFSWFVAPDMMERTALALTPGLQPGSSRQSFDQLRIGEKNLPELGNLADGQWRHVAVEFSPDGMANYYLDGQLVGTLEPTKPQYLQGDTLVLGAFPAPASQFAGVRGILRSWDELLGFLRENAEFINKRMPEVESHYAAELAAPFVQDAGEGLVFPANASGFAPNERAPLSTKMTLQAVHNEEEVILRIRGQVPPQGFMPAIQVYLDPTPDRSGALQISIPQLSKEQDPLRDFVQEGVGAVGEWAAWFSRDLGPDQYKDLPVNWRWSRKVQDGFYEFDVRVPKDALLKASGKSELPRHLGLQVYQWIAPWSRSLTWRGRIDPATYGTLELLPP